MENCVNVAPTVGAARAHARHVSGKRTEVFTCRLCPDVYVTMAGLQRQYSAVHPRDNAKVGYMLYPMCTKLISTMKPVVVWEIPCATNAVDRFHPGRSEGTAGPALIRSLPKCIPRDSRDHVPLLRRW